MKTAPVLVLFNSLLLSTLVWQLVRYKNTAPLNAGCLKFHVAIDL